MIAQDIEPVKACYFKPSKVMYKFYFMTVNNTLFNSTPYLITMEMQQSIRSLFLMKTIKIVRPIPRLILRFAKTVTVHANDPRTFF